MLKEPPQQNVKGLEETGNRIVHTEADGDHHATGIQMRYWKQAAVLRNLRTLEAVGGGEQADPQVFGGVDLATIDLHATVGNTQHEFARD